MWEYLNLGLGLATLLLLLYLFKSRTGKVDYWTKLGIPKIANTISLLDLLTGRKSLMDADTLHYASLVDGNLPYGGIMEFGTPLLLVKDTDLAKDIFIKDFHHFHDRRDFPDSEPLFQNSLFFMKGAIWRNMRIFLSPAFTAGRIRRMFPHFGRSAKNLQNYLTSQPSTEIRVNEGMRRFAVDVISATGFGFDSDVFANSDSTIFAMAEKMSRISLSRKIRFAIVLSFPGVANFFNVSAFDRDVNAYFKEVLRTVLRSRESDASIGKERDDFLQLIVEARKGQLGMDGEELTREEREAQLDRANDKDGAGANKVVWTEDIAISQSFIFLMAGFDAIANILAVATQQLAVRPEMQERVWQEVMDICGREKDISYEDSNAMSYLDNFLSETIRLFPPVSRIERKCMLDYPIPGSNHVIPAGTLVAFSVEAIHRDEKHWPNPMHFDPDRFTPEVKAARNSYAYMPFGIGPRNCIGMRFALVDTKVALANIVKNFKIVPTKSTLGPIRDVFGYRIPAASKLGFIPRK